MVESPRYRDENWLRDQLEEYSVVEVADECSVSEKTIYEWGGRFGIDFQNPTQYRDGHEPWNYDDIEVLEPWSGSAPAYVCGVVIGDGSLVWQGRDGRRYPKGVQLTTKDKEFVEIFAEAVGYGYGLKTKRYDDGEYHKVMVLSADLCRSFAEFNVYSDSWRIPKAFFDAERSTQISLLQGIMDSDGTAVTERKSVLTSTNLDGVTDVKTLATLIGMETVMKKPQHRKTSFGETTEYGLQIIGEEDVFRMTRKVMNT